MTLCSVENIMTLLSQSLMVLQPYVPEIIPFIFSQRVHNSERLWLTLPREEIRCYRKTRGIQKGNFSVTQHFLHDIKMRCSWTTKIKIWSIHLFIIETTRQTSIIPFLTSTNGSNPKNLKHMYKANKTNICHIMGIKLQMTLESHYRPWIPRLMCKMNLSSKIISNLK